MKPHHHLLLITAMPWGLDPASLTLADNTAAPKFIQVPPHKTLQKGFRPTQALVRACMLSRFGRVRLFVTPGTVAHQAPLSVGFSRQEYWSGLPCPPPGDLPDPGTEPMSSLAPALQVDSLLLSHWESPTLVHRLQQTAFADKRLFETSLLSITGLTLDFRLIFTRVKNVT